jgi:hypothetical protein
VGGLGRRNERRPTFFVLEGSLWNVNCAVVNLKEIESFNLKVRMYRNPMRLSNGEFIWRALYVQALGRFVRLRYRVKGVYLAVT